MRSSLQHLEHYLLPQLAVAGDLPDQVQRLLDREAAFNPWMERLQWQTDGFLVLVKNLGACQLRHPPGSAPG